MIFPLLVTALTVAVAVKAALVLQRWLIASLPEEEREIAGQRLPGDC